MIEFKLYGKTKHLVEEIKSFAKSIDGFAKHNNMWRIVLTNAKVTKGRVKKINDFAIDNGLKCYQEETDGKQYAQKHLGSFGSFLQ